MRDEGGNKGEMEGDVILIPDLVVEEQLMEGNPLCVARAESGNDIRSLAEGGGSIQDLLKGMTLIDLIQQEDGWVELAVGGRREGRTMGGDSIIIHS